MMAAQVSRNDVAHLVTSLCDELVAVLADAVVELRGSVYHEIRLVV